AEAPTATFVPLMMEQPARFLLFSCCEYGGNGYDQSIFQLFAPNLLFGGCELIPMVGVSCDRTFKVLDSPVSCSALSTLH
ncbi:MAG: hypothetical protein ACRCTW_06655, partial [Lactococcus garvieae]